VKQLIEGGTARGFLPTGGEVKNCQSADNDIKRRLFTQKNERERR
jgi:hypothetical protein